MRGGRLTQWRGRQVQKVEGEVKRMQSQNKASETGVQVDEPLKL